jgi:hypothetical protein
MPHKAEGTNTHGRPPLHCFWSEEDVKISWWFTSKKKDQLVAHGQSWGTIS